MALSSIRWGRIVLGAFLAELGIFAIVIPILLRFGERPEQIATPPVSLVLTFVCALWVVRGVKSHQILQGLLVGVFGTLMYVALAWGQPEPALFLVAHVLKMVGGAAAGVVARRQQSAGVRSVAQ